MSLPYIPKFGPDSNNREEENFVINNDKPPPEDESPAKQNQRHLEGQKFTFNNEELSEDQAGSNSSTSSPMNDVCNEQEDTAEAELDVPSTYSRPLVPTMKQNDKGTVGVKDSNAPRATAALPPRHQKPNKKSLSSSAVSAKSLLSAAAPTALGSVIEPGQEATGRWTRDEHEAFLIGLKLYGKEWKKVAAQVRTRTVVQTRTHAQKYFQKLQKAYNSGEVDLAEISGLSANEIAIVAESLGTTINYKEPNKGHQSVSIKRSKKDPQQQPEKNGEGNVLITLPILPGEDNEQLQQEAVNQMQQDVAQQQQKKSSPSSISLLQKPSTHFQQHEFSVPEQRPGDLGTDRFGALVTISSDNILSSDKSCKVINFTADQPKSFPPPSPAACGKRKLAELAVAQMLAGVISSTSTGSGRGMNIDTYEKGSLRPNEVSKCPKTPVFTQDGTAKNLANDQLPISDGDKLVHHVAGKIISAQSNVTDSFLTPKASLPVRYASPSLQIVNPDSLGVHLSKRRHRDGIDSPFTPWDWQLKALVSDAKIKEENLETADAKLESVRLKNDQGELEQYHPLIWDDTLPRPSIHKAIYHGNIKAVAEILKQNKSDQITDEITEIISDFGHSGAEKQQNLTELSSDDLGLGYTRSRSLLSGESFEKLIPHSIPDSQSFTPLHLAASLDFANVGSGVPAEITRMLLSAGADVRCVDKYGNTALHWAARSGNGDVAHLLTLKNCALDAKNQHGETALHWAMRAGRKGQSAVRVLVEDGARVNIANNAFRSPLNVAAAGFNFTKKKNIKKAEHKRERKDPKNIAETRTCRANLFSCSPSSRTLVLHHPDCLEHIPKSESDWECPDRISSILTKLTEASEEGAAGEVDEFSEPFRFSPREITVSTDFERASLELISRVHSAEYLDFVNELSKTLERRQKEECGEFASAMTIPFTPHIQRKILKATGTNVKGHSDTSFSVGSLRAARRAAGAVQHAVDRVLSGRSRNAFCIVRPPGHHAGVNGLLENSDSCGFCIFNNVAIGALHALSERHQVRCQKVAIVDIDAHHGNGTEEIVRRAHDSARLFFFSVHLYDNPNSTTGKYTKGLVNKEWSFYPGTGDKDDMAHNIINVPLAPLWREREVSTSNSNGATVTAGGNVHNTRNRAKKEAAAATSKKDMEGFASESDQSSKRISPGKTGVLNDVPTHYLFGTGRKAYRRAIRTRLLPSLRAFNPDLILISAGFDACRGDVGNAKHMIGGKEMAGIDLDPEDYAWTTRKIMEVADICCHGRVVSVLEGGYGRTPKRESENLSSSSNTTSSSSLLDKAVFSESVMRHLRALIDPYDSEKRHPRQRLDDDDSGDED